MPGRRAALRSQPDPVLDDLEREGQEGMALLRDIVTRVFAIGPSLIADANVTRALAIHAVDTTGRRTPQFFAILTGTHKGFHRIVGPQGFSLQLAFRKDSCVEPRGIGWVCDRFDYVKGSQVWWRNDLPSTPTVDVDSILQDANRARESFCFCGNDQHSDCRSVK
jgi:hypothetical protein